MFSFEKAPQARFSGPIKATKKKVVVKPQVDLVEGIARIIDPWPFSYTDDEIKLLALDEKEILRRRDQARRRAQECQEFYQKHAPSKVLLKFRVGRKMQFRRTKRKSA